MKPTFPFGAVYLIEEGRPLPVARRDLAAMRKIGFDRVTLWPAANAWLAERPDTFAFDDTLRMLDICAELGLSAIIQLIGQNQAQEYMPDCLVKESMLVFDEDRKNANCFWVNPNHPEVEKAIHHYIREAVSALKGHSAVYAWDIFNEAHLRTDDPWTTALYHRYLEEKYGDIRNLNRRWYRRFSSFSEIMPLERRAPYSIWSSLLPAVEYELFRSWNLTRLCRQWAEWVKEADPKRPVMVDGTAGQLLRPDITQRNNDEFATARVADIYGGTFYPKSWGMNLSDSLWELALMYELPASAARKAGKPYVINELQTHTQSALTPGSEVAPRELSAWVWMGISSGAESVQLWRWRPFLHGYQATGRGLTAIDGSLNARAYAMEALVRQIRKNEALLTGSRPARPAVRIAVSYRNRTYHDAFFRWQQPGRYPAVLKGWYRAFWESALPTAICELETVDRDDLTAPALVLPSQLSISAEEAALLKTYVQNGGLLITEARLGTVDEWGVVPEEGIPGKKLEELFGFKEEDVAPESTFAFEGETAPAPFMRQLVKIHPETEVLASFPDGNPAILRRRHGKGCVIYAAFFVSEAFQLGQARKFRSWLVSQILSASPASPSAEKGARVHAAFHENGNEQVAYLVSTSEQDENVIMILSNPPKEMADLSNGILLPASQRTVIPLKPWETRILRWKKE